MLLDDKVYLPDSVPLAFPFPLPVLLPLLPLFRFAFEKWRQSCLAPNIKIHASAKCQLFEIANHAAHTKHSTHTCIHTHAVICMYKQTNSHTLSLSKGTSQMTL